MAPTPSTPGGSAASAARRSIVGWIALTAALAAFALGLAALLRSPQPAPAQPAAQPDSPASPKDTASASALTELENRLLDSALAELDAASDIAAARAVATRPVATRHRERLAAAVIARVAVLESDDSGFAAALRALAATRTLADARAMAKLPVASRLAGRLNEEIESHIRALRDPRNWGIIQYPSPELSPEGHISALVFSPTEDFLALGSGDGTIRVWNTSNRELVRILRADTGNAGSVTCLAFSTDGRVLVSGYDEGRNGGSMRVWTVVNWECRRVWTSKDTIVTQVAVSPDGTEIAGCTGDSELRLWSTDNLTELRQLASPPKDSAERVHRTCAAYSPDGKHLYCGTYNGVEVWNAQAWFPLKTLTATYPDGSGLCGIESLSVSPDGRRIAAALSLLCLAVWDVGGDTRVKSIRAAEGGNHEGMSGVAFSPDGQFLATASLSSMGMSFGETIRIWDAKTLDLLRSMNGESVGTSCLAFSRDSRVLGSCGIGNDRTVKLWDPAIGKQVDGFASQTGGILAVAYSPDGQMLASAAGDETLLIRDAFSNRRIHLVTGLAKSLTALAFAPDGLTIAGAFEGGGVVFFSAPDWKPVEVVPPLPPESRGYDERYSLCWNFDGSLFALGRLLHVSNWHQPGPPASVFSVVGSTVKLQSRLPGASGPLQFVAKDQLVAMAALTTSQEDVRVVIFDPITGSVLRALTTVSSSVSIALAPDGLTLAVAGLDRLWLMDMVSGMVERSVLLGLRHSDNLFVPYPVQCFFMPDGETVGVTAGRTVYCWTPRSRVPLEFFQVPVLLTYMDYTDPYRATLSMALSPDGTRLALGCLDDCAYQLSYDPRAAEKRSRR
jgi:WD40 repeat protein